MNSPADIIPRLRSLSPSKQSPPHRHLNPEADTPPRSASSSSSRMNVHADGIDDHGHRMKGLATSPGKHDGHRGGAVRAAKDPTTSRSHDQGHAHDRRPVIAAAGTGIAAHAFDSGSKRTSRSTPPPRARARAGARAAVKRKQHHDDSRDDATDQMLDVITQMEQLTIAQRVSAPSAASRLGPTAQSVGVGESGADNEDTSEWKSGTEHKQRTTSKSSSSSPETTSRVAKSDTEQSSDSFMASEKDLVRCYIIVDHLMELKSTAEKLSAECYGQTPGEDGACYHFEQDTNLKVWDTACVLDKMRKVLRHLEDAHTEWSLLPEALQAMYSMISEQITVLKEKIVQTFRNLLNEIRGIKRQRGNSYSASPSPPPPLTDERRQRDSVSSSPGRLPPTSSRPTWTRSASRSSSSERSATASQSSPHPSSASRARKNSAAPSLSSTSVSSYDSDTGSRRRKPWHVPRHQSSSPARRQMSRGSGGRKLSLSSDRDQPPLSSPMGPLREPLRGGGLVSDRKTKTRRTSPSPVPRRNPERRSPSLPSSTPLARVSEHAVHAFNEAEDDADLSDVGMDDPRDFVDLVCIGFQ